MRVIDYTVTPDLTDPVDVSIPRRSRLAFVTADPGTDDMILSAVVPNPAAPTEARRFYFRISGVDFPSNKALKYVGTVIGNTMTYHVMENSG